MNAVFIIPTGLGCAIGGHSGDATPAAKLVAHVCDKLILHPNVVNASDINEMPPNALYVEGSILDRFLEGTVELEEVHGNKVLVVVNSPLKIETANAVNAARVTIGLDTEILELRTPLVMRGWIEDGIATGDARGVSELIQQLEGHIFDAVAIASPIQVSEDIAMKYFCDSSARVNPWGGIEARVSREVADAIDKPVAHAPIDSDEHNSELFNILWNKIVDPRKAPEVCSACYIHCILKGLYAAPQIGCGIKRSSVVCMVSPTGCIGRPHVACFEAGIPIVAVEENTTAMQNRDDRIIYVANYLEAAGVVSCISAGMRPGSISSRYAKKTK